MLSHYNNSLNLNPSLSKHILFLENVEQSKVKLILNKFKKFKAEADLIKLINKSWSNDSEYVKHYWSSATNKISMSKTNKLRCNASSMPISNL